MVIELNEHQKKTYMKARIDRFMKKYQDLVAEQGMQLVPILNSTPTGITPELICIPKNIDDGAKILDDIRQEDEQEKQEEEQGGKADNLHT